MKRVHLICLILLTAGILNAQPGKNSVLIVLQENTGKLVSAKPFTRHNNIFTRPRTKL